jgi:serine protease inhibitor
MALWSSTTRRSALVTAIATIALAAQNKTPARRGGPVADPGTLIEQSKPAAESQNRFGLNLLSHESAAHPHSNVFISPLSLYLALAMTEGGAAGKTRAAMRKTLEVPDSITEDAMHESASALLQSLRSQKGTELAIANALWSDPSMPLAPAFVEKSKTLYDAEAKTLEFMKPGAADIVNAWVSEKTKTKIPKIVTPEIVQAARALLTNAVYFAGKWRNEFWEGNTADADFHLADGKTKKIRMMRHPGIRGAYRTGDGYECAALFYQGSTIAMYAVLPATGVTPEQALAKATPANLIDKSEPFDLDLRLPRFTMGYDSKLKDTLSSMGMGIAFQFPGAEFAPLGSPLFYIGQVLHKTRLEVDEKGTVAAAATAVVVMVGSAAPRKQETKILVFDRPFAVMICDSSTGAVLFEGVVYEP